MSPSALQIGVFWVFILRLTVRFASYEKINGG